MFIPFSINYLNYFDSLAHLEHISRINKRYLRASMQSNSRDQRDAVRHYLADYELSNCFGVSLTLKQNTSGVYLDDIRASQNLRHFLNLLNSEVYGKRFRRFGKKLNVIPSLERSLSHRLHYHLILQNPYPENPTTFSRLVEALWSKTQFGYVQSHIDQQIDQGWTHYITKFKTASDGIDWENYHWN